MSKIHFNCPACNKRYSVVAGLAGKSANCKQCKAKLVVPVAGENTRVQPATSQPSVTAATSDDLPQSDKASSASQSPANESPANESPAKEAPTDQLSEQSRLVVAEVVADADEVAHDAAGVETPESGTRGEVEMAEPDGKVSQVEAVEVVDVLVVAEEVGERSLVTPVVVHEREPEKAVSQLASSGEISSQALLAAISGKIKPVPTTMGYRIAAFAVANLMVLLPVIYVGIIGLVIWGIAAHGMYNTEILSFSGNSSPRASFGRVLLYGAPLVVGTLTVLFMIKPLFARGGGSQKKRSLERADEPVLFQFVDRLCDAVHAPRPKRIDVDCEVNASASFRRGIVSMFLSNDLVLTIGMPLAAGLSVRQLGGVLAHEFGHFSQGFGMRMSYLIRTISFWFARVVYVRDQWDQWLEKTANSLDIRLGIVFHLSRMLIWLTRRILWCLMMIGNVVSSLLLRQMEFDADLHEIRFSGSDNFRKCTMQLRRLGVAYQFAMADQQGFFLDGKLGNDLPLLTAFNRDSQDEKLIGEIFAGVMEEKTEWLATHPVDKDRVARAKQEDDPGVFSFDAPASTLFSDFPNLSQAVTRDFFDDTFGEQLKGHMLVPTEDLIAHKRASEVAQKALRRTFGYYFRIPRQMALPASVEESAETTLAVTSLKAAREQMAASFSQYNERSKSFDLLDTRWLNCHQASALLGLGLKLEQKAFDVPVSNAAAAKTEADECRTKLGQLNVDLQPYEATFVRRVTAAIRLLQNESFASQLDAEATDLLPLANSVCRCLPEVQAAYAEIVQLRNEYAPVRLMLAFAAENEMATEIVTYLLEKSKWIAQTLVQLRARFEVVDFPFQHADGEITLARYLIPEIPPEDEVGDIGVATEKVLEQYDYVYFRCVGELTRICEAIESALGIPLQDDPVPPTENDQDEEDEDVVG